MLEHTDADLKLVVLRSNPRFQLLSPSEETWPEDKEAMMKTLRTAMENHNMFKDERFRAL